MSVWRHVCTENHANCCLISQLFGFPVGQQYWRESVSGAPLAAGSPVFQAPILQHGDHDCTANHANRFLISQLSWCRVGQQHCESTLCARRLRSTPRVSIRTELDWQRASSSTHFHEFSSLIQPFYSFNL